MFDAAARKIIDPILDRTGSRLAALGLRADTITLIGLALGLLAAVLVVVGAPLLAIVPLLLGRIADGLDGAVARASQRTDFGGYLDIVADFAFYGAVPFAFVLKDPVANGIAGGFLLLSFYINGASFLGFAIMAAKRGMETDRQGLKSLYYSNGLLEGTETILFFLAFCLWPEWFAPLATVFAILCIATTVLRLAAARQRFSS